MPEKFTWFFRLVYKIFTIPYIKRTLYGQGIGRRSLEEIQHIARGDMMALSTLLGDKPFFLGNKPTTLDACVFGIIGNVLHGIREDGWPNKMVKDEFPNLVAFSNRMKERYWPDWEKIITKKS